MENFLTTNIGIAFLDSDIIDRKLEFVSTSTRTLFCIGGMETFAVISES